MGSKIFFMSDSPFVGRGKGSPARPITHQPSYHYSHIHVAGRRMFFRRHIFHPTYIRPSSIHADCSVAPTRSYCTIALIIMPRNIRNALSVLAVLHLPAKSFGWISATPRTIMLSPRSTRLNSEAQTFSSIDSSEESDDSNTGRPNLTGSLFQARWIEFALTDHKPLGCSVEESLASELDGSNYVFVSEVRWYQLIRKCV